MSRYQQRKFRPVNYRKYKGDVNNIFSRSSWELRYMKWLDMREDVIEWSSEEVIIPYKHPLDGRVHRYIPDFKVKFRNKEGQIETWIVEIKPEYQTKEPAKQKRATKRYLNEVATYAINHYKWKYAEEWCKDRKYRFVVLTEKHLGIA